MTTPKGPDAVARDPTRDIEYQARELADAIENVNYANELKLIAAALKAARDEPLRELLEWADTRLKAHRNDLDWEPLVRMERITELRIVRAQVANLLPPKGATDDGNA